ncbi:MAG: sulfotransferase, partial [Gammaproteobacteria bacterium]|nr:sulfotransferase [Gammaproteobacteria bacterium]
MQQTLKSANPLEAILKKELDAGADALAAGNMQAASEAANALLAKAPDNYQVLQFAGVVALAENHPPIAASHFRRALPLCRAPLELARTWHSLGIALFQMGDHNQACDAFSRAAQAHPGNLISILDWANTLMVMNRHGEAEAILRKAMTRFPDDTRIPIMLGNILTAQNRQVDALQIYDTVLEKQPELSMAHFNRSVVLTMLGRTDEAEQAVMRSLELEPTMTGYYQLSNLHVFTKEDPWFTRLIQHAQLSLDDAGQIDIDFALSKAYEDIGDYDQAFTHLQAANTRKRRSVQYSGVNEKVRANRITTLFTPDFFAQFQGKVSCDIKPIFILGMPRSGSTLLEQMLAAHPAITAGGELPHMIYIAKDIGATWGSRGLNFPGNGAEIINDLQMAADQYAAMTLPVRQSKEYFTDKLPGNFQFIGLLHLMFPHAIIINCKRDPMDTCLSCYQRLFTSEVPYCYDLTELGQYYRLYDALMQHWHKVLPGRILDIEYEKLVA